MTCGIVRAVPFLAASFLVSYVGERRDSLYKAPTMEE